MQPINVCKANKLDGSKCRTAALPQSEFCLFHDPSRAKQCKEGRSRGGRGNRLKTLNSQVPDLRIENSFDIIEISSQTINQVRKGELDPRIANAVGYHLLIVMRAIEQSEVQTRIARLERLLKVE
jgi:hypothetical protein